ncbi:DNA internalization-related competence protein ComEC/Rec2 [candidate division WOR-1 bacterium RIFOXYA12_FULL_52_29]|uniref:DNA internalization-related competence protein ComEC/Rec2 n=1 Tax=candidate division WOR-1 bacterium RIFOXYC12_FULL_54_18 TaxID=1802584 RepID=A0A1F4T792_UNCSA|nr:MAG: DNA internalization-related competence protein ComEC/Rec2 [candidate division WOR-1 bacterium RIFOXYA2_FULL_51_19]OGC17546.1 MAG: DNA internalization-related competence protein ComEC/Rec2 [candidate division WOR-1 bacterium RIFOXYA12_FULL_52_29]OGC27963.1 MAG: DNA internalization-related competence protein ComEC/Rec2 [candidate division WOR-1 bacterium RIFOXYC12_FULL_54_18]OGC29750.1 MAG: DNA internalization-related competence protein ComEC/Rec2 [candidate division WOR-1 bacterium RIFOXY
MLSPIVLLTAAYALGIALGQYIPPPLPFYLLLLFVGLAVIAIIIKIKIGRLLLVIFLLFGLLQSRAPQADPLGCFVETDFLTVQGEVAGKPNVSGEKVYFPFTVIRANENKIRQDILVFLRAGKPIEYGDKLELRGRLSRPEKLLLFSVTHCRKLGSGGNWWNKVAFYFSDRFNDVLVQILPLKEASLLGSVLLGSSVSPLDPEVKEEYRKAGLIHLLVVSGTQVSILIGVCLSLAKICRFPVWLSVAVATIFNLLLVVVTGGGASILRAAIMGEIALVGQLFDREKEFSTALALSALILLLFDPNYLFDLGFQLSFLATWSLFFLVPPLTESLPEKIPGRELFALSIGPLLATTPLIVYNFNQFSLAGIISNFIVLPWIETLVVFGFSTAMIGFIFLPLAKVLGGTLWLGLAFLDLIAKAIAALPAGSAYVRQVPFIWLAVYYLVLLNLIKRLATREGIKRAVFLFIIVFFLPLFIGGEKGLVVTFIDVGQGDAAFIECPNGRKILIDGGGEESDKGRGYDRIGKMVLLPFLRKQGVNKLDLVIATHPHADHIGGLNEVLRSVKVDNLIDNGEVLNSPAYRRFQELIALNKIRRVVGRVGMTLNLGEVNAKILWPSDLDGTVNGNSIVLRLAYGATSFLFTGDLDDQSEARLLGRGENLRSTILKVGHHGSATSTSDEFLAAVSPKEAVISVGKRNRYGHPSKKALAKLAPLGLLMTKDVGAVTIRSDGRGYSIATERPCRSARNSRPPD